jgi:hypothetical protein
VNNAACADDALSRKTSRGSTIPANRRWPSS